jgi:hypothetical protein
MVTQSNAIAQSLEKSIFIRAKVLDSSSNLPISNCSVQLFIDGAAKPTKISSTDKRGDLLLYARILGASKISISHTAYVMSEINLTNGSIKGDTLMLGLIYLSVKVNTLQTVNIQSTKNVVQFDLNKIVYLVKADSTNKGLDGLDIIQKAPLVEIENGKAITISGKSDIKVLVDGRELNLSPGNFSYLKTLNSSTIERIEINNSPPIKYRQEGITRTLNIITNKSQRNGTFFKLTSEIDNRLGYTTGVSLYKKLNNVYMVANLNWADLGKISDINSTQGLYQNGMPQNNINSMFSHDSKSLLGNFDLTWHINKNESLNVLYNGYSLDQHDLYKNILVSGNVNASQSNQNFNQIDGIHFARLNYEKVVKDNQVFSLSAQLKFNNQEQLLSELGRPLTSNSNDYALQSDYSINGKKNVFELGGKINLRHFASSALFNIPKYEQNSIRSYFSFERMINPSYSLKSGVILDYSKLAPIGLQASSYFSPLPYINFAYSKNQKLSISFELNASVKRPSVDYIAPVTLNLIPGNQTLGNASLKQEMHYNAEVGINTFIKKKPANISFNVSYVPRAITSFKTLENSNVITSYNNSSDNWIFGSSIFYSFNLAKKVNIRLNANGAYVYFKSSAMNISNGGIEFKLMPTVTYYAPLKIELQLRTFGYSRKFSIQGYDGANFDTRFNVARNFIKDKLRVSFTLYQPFAENQNILSKYDISGYVYKYNTISPARYVSLSLRYDLGNISKAMNRKSNRGKQVNDDDIK